MHRDIKPENIMLRPDGYVKVLDSGIAKLTEQRTASDHMIRNDGAAANATGVSVRDCALHVAGTGSRPEGGRAHGYLEPGRSSLRNGRREPAVSRRDPERLHCLHFNNGAATFIRRIARCSPQTRIHSAKGFAQKQRRALPDDQGNARRPAHLKGELEADSSLPQIKARGEAIARTIKRHKRGVLLTLAAALLAAAAVAYFFFFAAPAQSPNEKSIAVLPFENRSEDKSNAYFTDGIQDEILTRLSKIGDLKVISRTSTQRYKKTSQNLSEIANQLGVANLLEGSVQKTNDQVRVNVQLIRAADDSISGQRPLIAS